ncbi:hypothetical protein A2686_03350 [Candidatus Woesebacteria bacterium RIFCSPHIGHO2_01_FULL_38_10]|uniref:Uncharacterized protein n=1 Tax=Candidatus Woesebacteria bacterium RIFCSPLOWO2_01_FULL_39_10b TaxID=1802517 RepID=A0A1F8B8L5_9BACT|nr:MAG: hypothetical protein A2686_03350 [Candidatus Woesebacteria bacterium RIFCSPHIGHO2_01_FULL_38_10]OGM60361.1 MAG: hypothetical protein A2892_03420 [Candidatus Woesebacteria bacterium RIFCSPLOWO2_01_FULL_39_10b]
MKKIAFNIGETFFNSDSHFLQEVGGVGELVSIFLANAIVIAGAIFLFLIIVGGFTMITSAGDSEKVTHGREIITTAIIGFIIILMAYWITYIIGNMTGIDILNTTKFQSGVPTPTP